MGFLAGWLVWRMLSPAFNTDKSKRFSILVALLVGGVAGFITYKVTYVYITSAISQANSPKDTLEVPKLDSSENGLITIPDDESNLEKSSGNSTSESVETPLPPPLTQEINDRFFSSQVYKQLKSQRKVDGELIGKEYVGQVLTQEEVFKIALKKFKQQAQNLGIPLHNITQKMFEGKFNPHIDDLKLAHEGLFAYSELAPSEKELVDKEPGENKLTPLSIKRNKIWNLQFGSINNLSVTTIINGSFMQRTDKDLLLRHWLRIFGATKAILPIDPNLTYKKAIQLLNGNPEQIKNLDYEIEKFLLYISSYQYFMTESNTRDFNLKQDYEDLRQRVYLPMLAEKYR